MKIHTSIPSSLNQFFIEKLDQYKKALKKNDLNLAWRLLEEAHILGQPYPNPHTLVHWEMLKFGIRIKSSKEILGQIPRLLVGGVKSFVGEIPVGNTGGANVPPLKPMPIPNHLKAIIEQCSK